MLYVRTGTGYRTATRREVLEEAAPHYAARVTAQRPCLKSPKDALNFLQPMLQDLEAERFVAVWLDTRHRVLSVDILFNGTVDGSSVHPREVVKRALALNATAVLLSHNHPSGLAQASHADEFITKRIQEALALVDIRLLDHIIIGHGETVSLAETGQL
jgi:DNA repair protein RadC